PVRGPLRRLEHETSESMTASSPRKHFIHTGPARVLMALFAGAAIGIALNYLAPATGVAIADTVQPIGRLWLNALQMTVVPLVAALIVVGINSASDAAASGRT